METARRPQERGRKARPPVSADEIRPKPRDLAPRRRRRGQDLAGAGGAVPASRAEAGRRFRLVQGRALAGKAGRRPDLRDRVASLRPRARHRRDRDRSRQPVAAVRADSQAGFRGGRRRIPGFVLPAVGFRRWFGRRADGLRGFRRSPGKGARIRGPHPRGRVGSGGKAGPAAEFRAATEPHRPLPRGHRTARDLGRRGQGRPRPGGVSDFGKLGRRSRDRARRRSRLFRVRPVRVGRVRRDPGRAGAGRFPDRERRRSPGPPALDFGDPAPPHRERSRDRKPFDGGRAVVRGNGARLRRRRRAPWPRSGRGRGSTKPRSIR